MFSFLRRAKAPSQRASGDVGDADTSAVAGRTGIARLTQDLLRQIFEENEAVLHSAGTPEKLARAKAVERAQRLVCRQFDEAAFGTAWRTVPLVHNGRADVAWLKRMPNRVASAIRRTVIACNVADRKWPPVVIAALRRMTAIESVAFGPNDDDPLADMPIFVFLAQPDAPRLRELEVIMPDIGGDGVSLVPAAVRTAYWRQFAAVLRAQTELTVVTLGNVNDVPDDVVLDAFDALAALPRLRVFNVQRVQDLDTEAREDTVRRSIDRVGWHTAFTLAELMLAYFAPRVMHMREDMGDGSEVIGEYPDALADVRSIYFDTSTLETVADAIDDMPAIQRLVLVCPWPTEFYHAVAETELVATLKDETKGPQLREFVVQLDNEDPDATLHTCHQDVSTMLAREGGAVLARQKMRAAYDALLPTLRERGIDFVCKTRGVFAFPSPCVLGRHRCR